MTLLHERRKEPELMDDPALDPASHARALRGLARLNWWSASPQILWPPILRWLRRHGRRQAAILDVATGGGDVPLALWRLANLAGLDLRIAGCDRSAQAVDYARQQARRAGADAEFFVLDAQAMPLPSGYDVVMCSLFLHHLEQDQAIGVMRRMGEAASGLAMANDLERSVMGLALAYAGTRLLSRSPVVHTDGPRSVRAAFSVDEVSSIAAQAGWQRVAVSRHWPCRFLVTWQKT